MPNINIRTMSGSYAPTATGVTTSLGIISNVSPSGVTQKGSVWRILAFACRVRVANDGNGTVAFGTTVEGSAGLMATTVTLSTATGLKEATAGTSLAGNGLTAGGTQAQAIDYLTATYTATTDTVTPVIDYTLILVKNEQFKKLLPRQTV